MLLVVHPTDTSDGWLGGSLLGREFWRELRGGGVPGAIAFKAKSWATYNSKLKATTPFAAAPEETPDVVSKPMGSGAIKAELNQRMRDTLRLAFFTPDISSCSLLSLCDSCKEGLW